VTVPHSDRPFEGTFTITSELSPMISPAYEPNRPTEQEVLLTRLLEKTIRRSGALDSESLCLVAAKKCWALRADVHVLSHDGNLVDASCLAVVAALRHFRKPDATVQGDGDVVVYTPAEREPVPLSWLHSPLCVSFSYFEIGAESEDGAETVALVDATWLEEQVRVASCTVGMNKHGEICQVSKMGGLPVDAITLLKCANTAVQKVKEFSQLLDEKLAADAKKRDKGGLMAELRAENDR
jgi:exosome complex component RRP45